ncbi:N-formylglutamate amidohydrolase [Winogradskyella undariae]|uniref:N-formylglutamate amidohydrolase n=1 Tax=Winogradskyella undariae TaxID=1285465 RepID=UPI0015CB0D68|nr:N-formylglutamate amidohydrolase [Winogradskyella undariae]
MKLILTCEHGGNEIPTAYKKHFKNKAILKTHRALDLGALDLFQTLKPLSDAFYFSTTSRLLIELNRSLHHKNLFSEYIKDLAKIEKTKIINTHYLPYRTSVEDNIRSFIKKGDSVLHLSIHSFTPSLNGENRNCDIGLLYNSSNKQEKQLCKQLKLELLKQDPNLNVRFNYPYLGKADGFTTYLRKQFSVHYLGIEIEVNQKFTIDNVFDSDTKTKLFNAISVLNIK